MKNTVFLRVLVLVLVSLFVVSCDKDYNTLGGDIAGGKPFDIKGELFDVVVYNQKIERVQTNNLSINQLGISSSTVFGVTRANFVTQLSLTAINPIVKSHAEIDSVVLTVPYFSTKLSTDSNGRSEYRLDSIRPFTSPSGSIVYQKMDLKVYENGYYLEDYDGSNFKKHYSDEDGKFFNAKGLLLNNDPRVSQNTEFYPSNIEYKKYKVVESSSNVFTATTEVESRSTPRMRLHLDKTRFQQILNDAKDPAKSFNFDTNDNFKKYFKGLYFKVSGNDGALMSLDFSKGDVTIYYKQDKVEGISTPKEMASLTLNMTGNTANTYDNLDTYDAIPKPRTGGNERLFLKGGQGCMALIDLFTNQTQFDSFVNKTNVIVNDATLYFTIDNAANLKAPVRVYLYDVDNNKPLLDYYADITVNGADTRLNKYIFGGIFERFDAATNTKRYKIKITELVRNIHKNYISDNTTKVRLGLVVTDNINNLNLRTLKKTGDTDLSAIDYKGNDKPLKYLPLATVTQASGIVLYGNLPSTDPNYDKRIRLEVNYTETK